MTALDAKYEYEYLLKYKNLSYLHVQWVSGGEIGKLTPVAGSFINTQHQISISFSTYQYQYQYVAQ
jgi:hypothetical protein